MVNLVVHYHEIALKGKNRGFFVKKLRRSLEKALTGLGKVKVRTLYGRVLVSVEGDPEEVHRRMPTVFGVANYSVVEEVPQEIAALCATAWKQVEESGARSFAIRTRRSDKNFPLKSLEVDRQVGAFVMERAREASRPLKVDLTDPEVTIRLEIVTKTALVSGLKRPGPGGLPVGTAGRVVGLLSSGFDSPVACWNLMKRGATVIMCHFHSVPYTDAASLDNCRLIAEKLTRFQYLSRLYLVPFAPVQEEIMSLTPSDLRMILYRRSMVRIAERVARKERAEALVTGESLGQVASQTLTNLSVIDQAASMPILRPLVGSDKEEIIRRSRQIDTYDISSRPYEDCCSLMVARHPVTHARLTDVLRIEEAMELEELEEKAAAEADIVALKFAGSAVLSRPG